jgi:hypothetical protein
MSVFRKNFLRTLFPAAALAAVFSLGTFKTTQLDAGIISGTPISTSTANTPVARMRWGGTGFEGQIRYTDSLGNTTDKGNLNPSGIPAWVVNSARNFQISYSTTATTGTFSLSVDFNNDGDFLDSQESTNFSETNLANTGFRGVRIWHTRAASSGTPVHTAKITNLNINGMLFADPSNAVDTSIFGNSTTGVSNWYKDSADAGVYSWNITGAIEFTGGNSSEAPRWEVRMVGAVPEPGSLSLFALGLGGIAGFRRRRS